MSDLPEILDDGTPFVDLQAAIQAAWIAGERALVADLMQRYGLWDLMCPRCACVPPVPVHPNASPNSLLIRLCGPCQNIELRPLVKPVTIIDSTAWYCKTHMKSTVELKPLLDKFKDKLDQIPDVKIEFELLSTAADPKRR